MRKIKLNNNLKGKVFHVVTILLVIFFLSACTKKATFPVSSVVPAAEGYVKVKQDKNDNYEIKVEVKHHPSMQEVLRTEID